METKTEERFDLKKVKVYRTREGNIFEAVTLCIVIAAWIIAGLDQQLDTMGDLTGFCGFSVVVLFALFSAYKPRYIHISGLALTNIRQVSLAIRLSRLMALEFSLMALMIAILMPDSPKTKAWAIGFAIVMGLTGMFFTYLIQKAE